MAFQLIFISLQATGPTGFDRVGATGEHAEHWKYGSIISIFKF